MRTTIPGPALPTLLNNSRKCEPIGSVLWKSLDAEGREAHRIEDIPLTESGDEVVIIVRTGRPVRCQPSWARELVTPEAAGERYSANTRSSIRRRPERANAPLVPSDEWYLVSTCSHVDDRGIRRERPDFTQTSPRLHPDFTQEYPGSCSQ